MAYDIYYQRDEVTIPAYDMLHRQRQDSLYENIVIPGHPRVGYVRGLNNYGHLGHPFENEATGLVSGSQTGGIPAALPPYAAKWDGNNDSMHSVASSSIFRLQAAFTIVFMIKAVGALVSFDRVLTHGYASSGGWEVYSYSNGSMAIKLPSNNNLQTPVSKYSTSWSTFAITREAVDTNLRFYHNGAVVTGPTSAINESACTSAATMEIGPKTSSSNGWVLQYAAWYAYEWSTAEVAELDQYSRAPTAYKVEGTVTEDSSDVAREVYAFEPTTWKLVGKTTSSAVDGSYTIELYGYDGDVYVMAKGGDSTIRPLAHGPVTPVVSV